MAKTRDLEGELWNVFGELGDVEDPKERATLRLKALDLVVKIRVAGEKVKADGSGIDPFLAEIESARRKVNGKPR